jgi:hypothetical protein
MGREIAVKHVVSDIDFTIGIPACEGKVLWQKYGFGELEPSDLFGLLCPKLFSEFW